MATTVVTGVSGQGISVSYGYVPDFSDLSGVVYMSTLDKELQEFQKEMQNKVDDEVRKIQARLLALENSV